MKFIAFKTADGAHKGNISFYCRLLHVTRQGFYQYLVSKDRPWKYQKLADAMMQIHAEDECNDTYGRIRMYQALKIKQPEGIHVPSERTVYRIMEEIGLSHRPNHKPNGITKADRQAQMSEDLLHRDFHADTPLSRETLKNGSLSIVTENIYGYFFSYFVRRALRSSLLRMYRTRRRKFLKLRKP